MTERVPLFLFAMCLFIVQVALPYPQTIGGASIAPAVLVCIGFWRLVTTLVVVK
jgi:hypothetical protein